MFRSIYSIFRFGGWGSRWYPWYLDQFHPSILCTWICIVQCPLAYISLQSNWYPHGQWSLIWKKGLARHSWPALSFHPTRTKRTCTTSAIWSGHCWWQLPYISFLVSLSFWLHLHHFWRRQPLLQIYSR